MMTQTKIDYFESYHLLSKVILDLVNEMAQKHDEGADDYHLMAEYTTIFNAHGWTFEYYLDAIPYDLTPMSVEDIYKAIEEGKTVMYRNDGRSLIVVDSNAYTEWSELNVREGKALCISNSSVLIRSEDLKNCYIKQPEN